MPNALTHYYFSEQLLKRLPETVKTAVEGREKAYFFASMGPDVLYGLKFSGNKEKSYYGEDIHTRYVRELFSAAKDDGEMPPELTAFFLGQLAHYSLDSVAHAYVYDYEHNRLPKFLEKEYMNDRHMLVEAAFDKYVTDTLIGKPSMKASALFDWGSANRKLLKEYVNGYAAPLFGLTLTSKDVLIATLGFRAFVTLCHKGGKVKKKFSEIIQKRMGDNHLFTAGYRNPAPKEWDILNLYKRPYNRVAEEEGDPIDSTFDEMFEEALQAGVKYLTDFTERRADGGELLTADDGFYIVNYDSRRLIYPKPAR